MGVYKFRWYELLPAARADAGPREAAHSAHSANAPLRRNRPAQTVVVTGTFDDWTRSQALDRVGDGFEKAVRIDDAADKIHYKVSGVSFYEQAQCAFGPVFCPVRFVSFRFVTLELATAAHGRSDRRDSSFVWRDCLLLYARIPRLSQRPGQCAAELWSPPDPGPLPCESPSAKRGIWRDCDTIACPGVLQLRISFPVCPTANEELPCKCLKNFRRVTCTLTALPFFVATGFDRGQSDSPTAASQTQALAPMRAATPICAAATLAANPEPAPGSSGSSSPPPPSHL